MLYFCQFKLDSWVRLVNKLLRRYLHAVAVIANRLALLEAVEDYLQAVVEVGALVLVEHAQPYLEQPFDVPVTVLVALQVERLLVFLQCFLFGQRAVPVQCYHLVRVAFARCLAVYRLHIVFYLLVPHPGIEPGFPSADGVLPCELMGMPSFRLSAKFSEFKIRDCIVMVCGQQDSNLHDRNLSETFTQ